MSDESSKTVGGLPAIQATVTASPTQGCRQLWPWTESPEPLPGEIPLRITAVDVDGEDVVLVVFGGHQDPVWAAMADQLIGTILFESP
jgi:hypothetical protein